MDKKLLVTGIDFLVEWCADYIKSAEFICTSDCSEENLCKRVVGCDGILSMQTMTYPITRKIVESGNKLKFIQSAGVGFEFIDLQAATENGVVVMNMPTGTTISVAEHTVGLILACSKNLIKGYQNIIKGKWRIFDLGVELQGKVLGMIGFGKIGYEVAKRMAAFEMEILVHDPFVKEEVIKDREWEKVDLMALLKESDIVTIHCPLTKETKGLIGENALSLMKKEAILINTARGGIVDEKALFKALAEGRIKGAGLDVYENEPIGGDNPLLSLENVVLTPHMAVQTTDAVLRFMKQNGEQVERALNGTYENVLNPGVLENRKK